MLKPVEVMVPIDVPVTTGALGLIVITSGAGGGSVVLPDCRAVVTVMVPATVPSAILVAPLVKFTVVLFAGIVNVTCREPVAAPLCKN